MNFFYSSDNHCFYQNTFYVSRRLKKLKFSTLLLTNFESQCSNNLERVNVLRTSDKPLQLTLVAFVLNITVTTPEDTLST